MAIELEGMRANYSRDELRREDPTLWQSDWRLGFAARSGRVQTSLAGDEMGGVRASFGFRHSVFGFRSFSLLLLLCCLDCFAALPRVLVYQKNGKGYVHENLAASAAAIRELGMQQGFAVEVSTDPMVFTVATLKQYRVLIFANSNNEAFDNDDQREAFQRYIRSGGGFVGIHSSTGSERQWPYFQQMQGAKFLRHPPLQKFTMNVLDRKHPATSHLGSQWLWTDECYFFTNLNPDIQVLLSVDTTTLRDPKLETAPGQKANGVFPLAWCHEFDGGRQFYTALGHKIECYSDPIFRKHLLGGIRWVMGEVDKSRSPSTAKLNDSERP